MNTLIISKGLTVATAESCTGGLLASTFTDFPGASNWFVGGVVVYTKEAKRDLLHASWVDPLSTHCVVVMNENLRKRLQADIYIAVSGIIESYAHYDIFYKGKHHTEKLQLPPERRSVNKRILVNDIQRNICALLR